MYGRQKPYMGTDISGNPKPASKNETYRLDEQRKSIEKEIEALQARKKHLESRVSDPECEKMFRLWGGSEIQDSTETSFYINFLAYSKGKKCGTYSIGLKKYGPVWNLSHHNLPYSIANIAHRVKKAELNTIGKLSSFIRCIQHEINLFVWRREQFNAAKALVSESFSMFPSISTTNVMLSFNVDDAVGSDLSKAYVHLIYHPHKFLPEEPLFTFLGGDAAAHEVFKDQLTTLECMPLKEAIVAAFPNTGDSTRDSTIASPEPEAKSPAVSTAKSAIEKPSPPASLVTRKPRQPSESSNSKESLASESDGQSTPAKTSRVDKSPKAPRVTPPSNSIARGRGRGRGSGKARRGRGRRGSQ